MAVTKATRGAGLEARAVGRVDASHARAAEVSGVQRRRRAAPERLGRLAKVGIREGHVRALVGALRRGEARGAIVRAGVHAGSAGRPATDGLTAADAAGLRRRARGTRVDAPSRASRAARRASSSGASGRHRRSRRRGAGDEVDDQQKDDGLHGAPSLQAQERELPKLVSHVPTQLPEEQGAPMTSPSHGFTGQFVGLG